MHRLRPRSLPILAVLILAVGLVGCGGGIPLLSGPKPKPEGTPQTALAELARTPSCCASLDQLPYRALPANRSETVVIDQRSPVYAFPSGKSFFAAYALPQADDLEVRLTSEMSEGSVLAPTLMLLNEDFEVSRTIGSDAFRYEPPSFLQGDRLSTRFRIKRAPYDDPRNERYLVIYTTPEQLQGETARIHPEKLRDAALGVEPLPVPDPLVRHAPMGLLALSVRTEAGAAESAPLISRRSPPAVAQPAPPASRQPAPAAAQTALAPSREPPPVAAARPAPAAQAERASVLPETERYFRQAVAEALAAGDVERALRLVEEADRVGAREARRYFIQHVQPRRP